MQTDDKQQTKIEIGNPKLDGAPTAPQIFKGNSRVSADSPYLTAQQLQFLLRVAPPALEGQRQYQIPACVTIAQAILESATSAGWGSSSLFRIANNPFGIKYEHFGAGGSGPEKEASGFRIPNSKSEPSEADSTFQIQGSESRNSNPGSPASATGRFASVPEAYGAFDAQTWEIVNGQKKEMMAQFQRFPNLTEAFIAHAQLLRGPRYRPAFAVRDDWKQFAERLGPKTSLLDSEHCGYSTNPSYSAELIKLVAMYRLDDPRALQWFATGKDPGAAVSHQLSAFSQSCAGGHGQSEFA